MLGADGLEDAGYRDRGAGRRTATKSGTLPGLRNDIGGARLAVDALARDY
jgi:hypothetical protein